MIKTRHLIFMAIVAMGTMLLATACSKEDDSYTSPRYINNTSGNSGGSSDDMATIVKDNVMATYSTLSNCYMYRININSTLANIYPNKTIYYGVECGYGAYALRKTESTSSSAQFLIPWCSATFGNNNSGMDNVQYNNLYVWRYTYTGIDDYWETTLYNAGISNPNNAMSSCCVQLRVFLNLQNKLDQGATLTEDERMVYNDARNIIESNGIWKMKGALNIRVYCKIDGRQYDVGYIN